MVEYGLIVALIAVIAMAGVSLVGSEAKTKFDKVSTELAK